MKQEREDPYVAQLRDAQLRVDASVAEMNAAMDHFNEMMREAHDLGGYSYRALGEMLGVSAQRIHQILKPRPK